MALLRKSPSNRTVVTPAKAMPGSVLSTKNFTNATPYVAGKSTGEQTELQKKTAYLQPTAADLAKGNFTAGMSQTAFSSQTTSLSALQSFEKDLGTQLFASGPAPGGKGSVTTESFAKFREDIQIEESFGMLGSGAAGNIRLAVALTGQGTPETIAMMNKEYGIRQEAEIGQAAFTYKGQQFDKEANLVGVDKARGNIQLEGPQAFAFSQSLQAGAEQIAAELQPSGGTTDLTQFQNGVRIGFNTTAATTIKPLNPAQPIAPPGAIKSVTVGLPDTGNAGAQYRSDFIKATGVDVFNKPLITPTTVRAVKDITGISEGKAPTLQYADFLGKLTPQGSSKSNPLAGVRYADLYQPVSPGSSMLKLTSAGTSFRNLQIAGTPGANIKIKK
jgi:hypothetical protein